MKTKLLFVGLIIGILWPMLGHGEITAPESVPAGSVLKITWSGEMPQGGRFKIVSETGEALGTGGFGYLGKDGKSSTLAVPLQPGVYAVALAHSGKFHHLQTFKVTPVTAALEVPNSVKMNAAFEVKWTGPAYSSDIIAIAEVGANRRAYAYTYPGNSKNGTSVMLKAPLEPGDYDVIYLMKSVVLARERLTVGSVQATVNAPKTVQAGGELEIQWTGPNNNGDIISLTEKGATKRSKVYGYTGNSTENRLVLVVPEVLGDYEVVYFTAGKPLARHPVQIVAVSASLEAAAEVVSGLLFPVTWSGPGNRQDRIIMIAEGSEAVKPFASQTYLDQKEQQISMGAPAESGNYILHYITRAGRVLATRPIKVIPAPIDLGFLTVIGNPSESFAENSAVELILDASGSMLKRQGGKRRIEIAKETILGLLNETIPNGTGFALRVFGHKEADSCRTDLEIPLGPLDSAAARLLVSGVNAKNLAKTPIAASLEQVDSDLNGVTGERIVILVTDGEETCDGDPALAIRQLRAEDVDIRVNIIGYSIDDADLRETFESWAAIGGGQYLNAPDANQLAKALRQALEIPFEIFANDKLMVRGIIGGERLELPVGNYQIRYRWDGKQQIQSVTVVSNREANVVLP